MSVQSLIKTPPSDASGDRVRGTEVDAQVVVLGLGNLLLGDDGAGVHVVERLRTGYSIPANVLLVDGGTLSFSLLDLVECVPRLIVVDAMELDAPGGTVRLFLDEDVDRFLAAPAQRSVHDANLGDVLRMCALRGTRPRHLVLVGIQPQVIEWRETPSEAVLAGIRTACSRIDRLIGEWM